MELTPSKIDAYLREIPEGIQAASKRLDNAKALIEQAEADLTNMATRYADFVASMTQVAADSSGDEFFQDAKYATDKYVAEYQALKVRATAMKEALAGS